MLIHLDFSSIFWHNLRLLLWQKWEKKLNKVQKKPRAVEICRKNIEMGTYLSSRKIGDLSGILFIVSNSLGKKLNIFYFIHLQFPFKNITLRLNIMECSIVSTKCQRIKETEWNCESYVKRKKPVPVILKKTLV